MCVQRRSSSDDHEVEHQVANEHADVCIQGRISQLGEGRALALLESLSTHLDFFLHLLARLPKEEVRGNGGAEDCNQGHQIGLIE